MERGEGRNTILILEGFMFSGGQTRRGSAFYFALWTLIYLTLLCLIYSTGWATGSSDGSDNSFVQNQRVKYKDYSIYPTIACWIGGCGMVVMTLLAAIRDYLQYSKVAASKLSAPIDGEDAGGSSGVPQAVHQINMTEGCTSKYAFERGKYNVHNEVGSGRTTLPIGQQQSSAISPESRYVMERAEAIEAARSPPPGQWEDLCWVWPFPTILITIVAAATAGTPATIGALMVGFVVLDLVIFSDPTPACLLSPWVFTTNLFVTIVAHILIFAGAGISVRDWKFDAYWIAMATLICLISCLTYIPYVFRVQVRSIWYANCGCATSAVLGVGSLRRLDAERATVSAPTNTTPTTTTTTRLPSIDTDLQQNEELMVLRAAALRGGGARGAPIEGSSDGGGGSSSLLATSSSSGTTNQYYLRGNTSTLPSHDERDRGGSPTVIMKEEPTEPPLHAWSQSSTPHLIPKGPPPLPPCVGGDGGGGDSQNHNRGNNNESSSYGGAGQSRGKGKKHGLGSARPPVENLALMSMSTPVLEGQQTSLFGVVMEQERSQSSFLGPDHHQSVSVSDPRILGAGAEVVLSTGAGSSSHTVKHSGRRWEEGSVNSTSYGGSVNSSSFHVKPKAYMEMEKEERIQRIEQDGGGGGKTVPYKLGNVIGSGAHGVVHLALIDQTAETVCAKQIHFVGLGDVEVERQLSRAKMEIQMLKTLDHPNIVRYFFTDKYSCPVTQNVSLLIFMEYIAGGSLQEYVKQFGRLDERTCAIFAAQLLLGLEYLHSRKVIHRDIKPANCLVATNGVAKLTDFGTAWMNEDEEEEEKVDGGDRDSPVENERTLESTLPHEESPPSLAAPNATTDSGASGSGGGKKLKKTFELSGTPYYMAPEVIRGTDCSWRGDIWGFGCTLMELLTGQNPWSHLGDNAFRILSLVAKSEEDLALPETISPLAQEFLKKCLAVNPEDRWQAALLLRDPFFTQFDLLQLSYSDAQAKAASVTSDVDLLLDGGMNSMSGALNVLHKPSPPPPNPLGGTDTGSGDGRGSIVLLGSVLGVRAPLPSILRETDVRNASLGSNLRETDETEVFQNDDRRRSSIQSLQSLGVANSRAPVLSKEQQEDLVLMQGSLSLKPTFRTEVSSSVGAYSLSKFTRGPPPRSTSQL